MNDGLSYSDAGFAMTKMFEGLSLTSYRDSGGVWTIGWGHTGIDIHDGMTITTEAAEALLCKDVADAERSVRSLISVQLTQGQFDALVDFVFNLGGKRLQGSTLRMKINSGDIGSAPAEIMRWNKATDPKTGGMITLEGLTRRRAAEVAVFLGGSA